MTLPLFRLLESQLDPANEDRKKANSKSFRPHGGRLECECCGAQTKEYRHKLSKGLGESLVQFFRYGGRAKLRDLHLSYSKRTNFQKLRYFGLVTNDEKLAMWTLTDKGEQFVRGTIRVQEYVWTWQADPLESEGKGVLITELVPDYNHRIDYAKEGRPHDVSTAAH